MGQRKLKVIKAKSAGFCWGVERAVNIVKELAEKGEKKTVFTDGPLIHNQQMMDQLESSGVKDVGDYTSQKDLSINDDDKNNSILVVRAHGISPQRREYLKGLGMQFKDATCPDVGVIAGKIRLHANKGYSSIIFGDPKHPEVIGLLGYTNEKGYVIKSKEDIDNLPDLGEKVCMVSQSTMFTDEFETLSQYAQKRFPGLLIFDTICGATKERQSDIISLMQQNVEAFIVIGGKHSANTMKLVALAKAQNRPTFHIETANEINEADFKQFKVVGLTAGASTPDFIINAVQQKLESIDIE